jgi:hypothetical protein
VHGLVSTDSFAPFDGESTALDRSMSST